MKVIAGLGNPGAEYANTPHNIGFDVVNALAVRWDATWKGNQGFHAETSRVTYAGIACMLMKPLTFMNLSGTSIVPALRYFHGKPEDLVVLSDDIDLPLGRIRIRGGGGSGGHRGLASIIEALGTETFTRIRVGVGRREHSDDVVGHVLGKFGAEQRERMAITAAVAAEAVEVLLVKGLNEAMNRFNGYGVETPTSTTENETHHE